MTPEEQLIELERSGWGALSSGGEAATAFYDEVLAAHTVMLLPGGTIIDDRAQIIGSMQGAPWDEFRLEDERVHRLGDGVAAVLYRAVARRGDHQYTALFNSTYVLQDGHWRLSIHQQTPA